jgi:hypothetical protein
MARTLRDYVKDDVRRLADRITLLEPHGPPDLAEASDFASSVSDIYAELGSSPPQIRANESPRSYELRSIGELQRQIPNRPQTPLSALAAMPDQAFRQMRDEIVASARTAARRWAPPGQLRERWVDLGRGAMATEFVGDSMSTWSPFMRPATAVKRFSRPNGEPLRVNRRTVVK